MTFRQSHETSLITHHTSIMKRIILLTALAALFVLPSVAQEKKSPSFDEVLTTRRSIRSYDATKKISVAEVRTLFSIPENETVMAVIALGYRKGQPVQPRHRQLDDVVKFY